MAQFTTRFLSVPATAIGLPGLPAGPSANLIAHEILSSLAGVFAVSADTARLIGDLLPEPEQRRLAA